MAANRPFAALFLLGACGSGGNGAQAPGTVVTPTPTPSPSASPSTSPSPSPSASPTTPACNPVIASPTSRSPYSDPAFRTALDNALTLQWPVSTNACMNTTSLAAFTIDLDNFYRDEAGRMVFAFTDGVVDSNASITTRMELRGANFNASATAKMLDASFQLPANAGRSPSFTIAQVFSDSDGAPIVRIAVIASREGKTNHMWAAYRRALGDNATSFSDLGPAPAPGETARIRIGYNIGGAIEIFSSATNTTLRLTDNLAFWTDAAKRTYFKAGCYLQSAGGCEVRYTALSFDR